MITRPDPARCDDCPEHAREYYGCPLEGYEGQGRKRANGATEEPWNRTCQWSFWCMPWVQAIMADVPDYERGTLGDVRHIEAPHLAYLRVALEERNKWKAEQMSYTADSDD